MAMSIESTVVHNEPSTSKNLSDVVSKTIALAKDKASNPPQVQDVISKSIELAKEKEKRKEHPLTGGLRDLLGNMDIQTHVDNLNATKNGTIVQIKNVTVANTTAPVSANVTAPKLKKNTTTPDGSKEPSKPDLGNSSTMKKSASAGGSSAKNVTTKVDKIFKDAAKLPEHSHDGIKVSNDTKPTKGNTTTSLPANATGNSTFAQKVTKTLVANATKVNSTATTAKIAKKM